jgi:hypothetical protein
MVLAMWQSCVYRNEEIKMTEKRIEGNCNLVLDLCEVHPGAKPVTRDGLSVIPVTRLKLTLHNVDLKILSRYCSQIAPDRLKSLLEKPEDWFPKSPEQWEYRMLANAIANMIKQYAHGSIAVEA